MFVRGHHATAVLEAEGYETEATLYEALAAVGVAQRELLRRLVLHEATEPWLEDDCHDMVRWTSLNLGMTPYRAERWLRAAKALENLPRLSAALETGSLNLDKVCELCRFATPEDEQELVTWARKKSVTAIKERGDELEVKELDEVVNDNAFRSLKWWTLPNTYLGVMGVLPPEEGAAFVNAIERLTKEIPDSPSDDDAFDPIEARRADALVAMASGTIASDSNPARADVVVHIPIESLVSSGGPNGLIAGGPPLHPEVVARLKCDCRIQPVLERDGKPIWVGSNYRIAPNHIRRVVEHRDRYRCTFPGCGTKRFTQCHHIVPWPVGPTEPDNLVLICGTHHKLVHDHGWHVNLKEDGTADWRRPDWTPYVPGPPPKPKRLKHEALRNELIARRDEATNAGSIDQRELRAASDGLF